jgi:hypothetical protein
MPLESIACTNCGSTDAQEVKAGTYFCNYCEGVFKFVDPTKVTVEAAPAFCRCGNPIQVQCNQCQRGMCLECDEISHPREVIPTVGYGFIAYRYGLPIADMSPFISGAQLSYAIHRQNGQITHLCGECSDTFLPIAVECIMSDEICRSPLCPDSKVDTTSSYICGCCKHRYCHRSAGWAPIVVQAQHYRASGKDAILSTSPCNFPIDSRGGLCGNCSYEWHQRVLEFTKSEHREIEHVGYSSVDFEWTSRTAFVLRVVNAGPKRARQVEAYNQSTDALAKSYADKIGSIMQSTISPTNCRCANGIDIAELQHLFSVSDSRDTTSVASAPDRKADQ